MVLSKVKRARPKEEIELKKIICILLAAVMATPLIYFASSAEVEEEFNIFRTYQISNLALQINEDFSAYRAGTSATIAGFEIQNDITRAEVVTMEEGNNALRIHTDVMGEARVSLPIPDMSGLVIIQISMKVEGMFEYNQAPSILGVTRDGTITEAAIVAKYPPNRTEMVGAFGGAFIFPVGQWNEYTIVMDTNEGIYEVYFNGVRTVPNARFMCSVTALRYINFLVRNPGSRIYIDNIKIGSRADATIIREEIFDPRPNLSFPQEMLDFTEAEILAQRAAGEQMAYDIRDAIDRGDSKITIEPGFYRIGRDAVQSIIIDGARDFTVNAHGVHVIQESTTAHLIVRNSINTTVRGFKFDLATLPFTQGVVTALHPEDNSFDVLIDQGYMLPDTGWVNQRVMMFNYDGSRMLPKDYNDNLRRIEPLGGKNFRLELQQRTIFEPEYELEIGSRLAISLRGGSHAVIVSNSTNCVLEDIDVYAAGYFGAYHGGGNGGNIFRRFRIIRRPETDRLISVSSDGFHAGPSRVGPQLIEVEIAHTQDDLVNIQANMNIVYDVVDGRTMYVCLNDFRDFDVGSEIMFYDLETLEYRGSANIVDIQRVTDPRFGQNATRLPSEIMLQTGVPLIAIRTNVVYRVRFDRDVDVLPFDVFVSHDFATAGSVIRDSYFHNGFVRGIMLRSPGGVIENNRFRHIFGPAIYINAERFWHEGPFPSDVRITGNIIDEASISISSFHVHPSSIVVATVPDGGQAFNALHYGNIEIRDNRIYNSGGAGIFIVNTFDSIIADNYIINPWSSNFGRLERSGSAFGFTDVFASIFIDFSENITLENNTIINQPNWVVDTIWGENTR